MAINVPGGRSGIVTTPNVTPMIDVMLVLLIIFMIVTPAMDGAVTLPPGVHAVPRPEDVADRTLTIDARGGYHLNGATIAREELAVRLRALVTAAPENHVLYIRADKALQYRLVQDAMDLARANGIAVVGMVTEAAPRATGRGRASRTSND